MDAFKLSGLPLEWQAIDSHKCELSDDICRVLAEIWMRISVSESKAFNSFSDDNRGRWHECAKTDAEANAECGVIAARIRDLRHDGDGGGECG